MSQLSIKTLASDRSQKGNFPSISVAKLGLSIRKCIQLQYLSTSTPFQPLVCVGDRLTSIEDRLTSVEDHLTSVENRLTSIENHLTSVEDRLTSLSKLPFFFLLESPCRLESCPLWVECRVSYMQLPKQGYS